MKLKTCLVLMSVLAIIYIAGSVVLKIDSNRKKAELDTQVKEYLELKYEEEFVIEDEYSYYDRVYRLTVYPKGYEQLKFRVNVYTYYSRIGDDYEGLVTYPITEEIESIVKDYTEDYIRVGTYITKLEKMKLEDKIDLNPEEYLNKLNRVLIVLYNTDDVETEKESIASMMKEFALLSPAIRRIDFEVYNNYEAYPLPVRNYVFKYIDGEYIEFSN